MGGLDNLGLQLCGSVRGQEQPSHFQGRKTRLWDLPDQHKDVLQSYSNEDIVALAQDRQTDQRSRPGSPEYVPRLGTPAAL